MSTTAKAAGRPRPVRRCVDHENTSKNGESLEMGELTERLARLREAAKKSLSPEFLEQMHQATEELRTSGQADKALNEGDLAPDFELPDSQGKIVRLTDLLARTPVIVTFFRGHW